MTGTTRRKDAMQLDFKRKVARVGGSLAVRLPAWLVRERKLRAGQTVEVTFDRSSNAVRYEFQGPRRRAPTR